MNNYESTDPGHKSSPCRHCGEGEGWHLPSGDALLCDRCSNRGCDFNATAMVPGYPDPLPMCFQHEREYVDRYGLAGVAQVHHLT